ncbi:hypothetical protein F4810DRAFT_272213 [Camillea tinctor]|nr:hypothetical protein F4810DRAFT_272213 [Camillea tinctor]
MDGFYKEKKEKYREEYKRFVVSCVVNVVNNGSFFFLEDVFLSRRKRGWEEVKKKKAKRIWVRFREINALLFIVCNFYCWAEKMKGLKKRARGRGVEGKEENIEETTSNST